MDLPSGDALRRGREVVCPIISFGFPMRGRFPHRQAPALPEMTGHIPVSLRLCPWEPLPGSRNGYLNISAPCGVEQERNGCNVQVLVRDNNVDQALRALKKKLQREGVFREMKLRNFYEKPSEKRAREKAEAVRRARKLARKRMQREGLLPAKGRSR